MTAIDLSTLVSMKRRHFLKTTGVSLAALLLHTPFEALAGDEYYSIRIAYPDGVSAIIDNKLVQLTGSSSKWEWNDLAVILVKSESGL